MQGPDLIDPGFRFLAQCNSFVDLSGSLLHRFQSLQVHAHAIDSAKSQNFTIAVILAYISLKHRSVIADVLSQALKQRVVGAIE